MWPRIVPFGLYMACLFLDAALSSVSAWRPALASWAAMLPLWLYPVKTFVVLGALLVYWRQYDELHTSVCASQREGLLALGTGISVYLAWVRMDWPWATLGQATGYNPFQAGAGPGIGLAVVRLFGAAVVVPVMEELFWRSFLIRYLIARFSGHQPRVTPDDFAAVRLGAFTRTSFLATVLLFGSEHTLWLAGITAGAVYTLLLYRTHRLWPCILAHGVTNLLLGIHVLVTAAGQWW